MLVKARCRYCNVALDVEGPIKGQVHANCGKALHRESYVYVVWTHGTADDYHEWFNVWPTKEQAMSEARRLAEWYPGQYPDGVKFVSGSEGWDSYQLYRYVVVEETPNMYHGA